MRSSFMDELSKRAAKGKSGEALKEVGSELRHRPTSFYGTGQLVGDMPPGFLGLPTIFGQFHLGNRAEFRKVQQQVPGFDDIPFEQVLALPRGVALFTAARATDPLFTRKAQEVFLRPACVHAGGETLTAF